MRALILATILAITLSLQTACKEPEPLRIGFLGGLTTRAAGLSTSGRDGFLLAIEEFNARGGVNDRQVIALVQDSRMHKETALQAVKHLAANKVSAIIGPMTSQTAISVVPAVNLAEIPMISPTVSTNQLNERDDYFFRVYYTNAQAARLLANKLASQQEALQIAAIYDLNNRAYTEDWLNYFQKTLEQKDGAQLSKIPFDIRSNTLFLDLATQAAETKPQGILILANAVDTAMICQQLTKIGANMPRYATGWSYSDTLIQFGGKSVEGLTVIQSADMHDSSPAMQAFVKSYEHRFKTAPNFPALHAYDATRLILSILKKTTDPQEIRQELLNMDSFSGVQDNLSFDRYGDLKSPRLHLARITNGEFVKTD